MTLANPLIIEYVGSLEEGEPPQPWKAILPEADRLVETLKVKLANREPSFIRVHRKVKRDSFYRSDYNNGME